MKQNIEQGVPPRPKVLIFIVAYNATSHIERVLDRIPAVIWDKAQYDTEVLIIDDASKDNTAEMARMYKTAHQKANLCVLRNPVNQGYGGNQKIGYHYAISRGFDIVALLHGDGQYAPEMLPALIAPIADGRADAVFGSRMLRKRDALKGGMPLYKFIGNRVLTAIQNAVLGSHLSEFHSGYRVYAVAALAALPFACNSNDFDFDTDIIIQLLDTKHTIQELPIPTFYGDEICYVNGLSYARRIIVSAFLSRLQAWSIYYHPKFDYPTAASPYQPKLDFASSHQFAVKHVPAGACVLDIGCGDGHVARAVRAKGCRVYGVDYRVTAVTLANCDAAAPIDLDHPAWPAAWDTLAFDTILLLDVLEHLRDPAQFLRDVRARYGRCHPRVIVTTGNVAFVLVRLSLLCGAFNYGKRGILDITHTRLFTKKSLIALVEQAGGQVKTVSGVPAPFPLAVGPGWLGRALLKINQALIWLWPTLFSYQLCCEMILPPSLAGLLHNALESSTAQEPVSKGNE